MPCEAGIHPYKRGHVVDLDRTIFHICDGLFKCHSMVFRGSAVDDDGTSQCSQKLRDLDESSAVSESVAALLLEFFRAASAQWMRIWSQSLLIYPEHPAAQSGVNCQCDDGML